jgi:protein-disulfide isomerase
MTSELKTMIMVAVVTLIIVVGGVVVLSNQNSKSTGNDQLDPSLLVRDWSHNTSTDSANKKVTIVEFADFQCPACAAAFPVIQRIKSEYSAELNFVYRHFPLAQHRNAKITAKAAEAAGEQGKFWEMYEKLYLTQSNWQDLDNPEEVLIKYATELGLDIDKFKSDLSSNEISDRINKDVSDALELNVNSTPTFFINGERLTGAPSYELLKSKIETSLN